MDAETGPRRSRRPTIQDVARVAGVSPTTVSNALNNRTSRLSTETADRIRQACADLGFMPDELGRQLRRGHAQMIGVIVPSIANPFWGEFVRRVEDTARALDFTVMSASSDRVLERERSYVEAMYRQGIRAVIFGTSPLSLSHLSSLTESGLHIVVFDRRFRRGDLQAIDCITVDNREAGHLATTNLVEAGHRRIGFLSGPIKTASRRDRFAGYQRALAAAGIEFQADWVWAGSRESAFGDPEGGDLGRVGAIELMERNIQITALLAINDMYAIGAYAGLRSLGLAVPDDVSVVGFDDIVLSDLVQPRLTTVKQPIAEMADLAVQRLAARLQGEATSPPLREQWTPRLIVRDSVVPPPSPPTPTARRPNRSSRGSNT